MQLESAKTNPYRVSTPVRDAGMFWGPFSTLRTVCSIIDSHGCVSLVGARHAGKTTLLDCLRLPAMQARFPEYDFSHHLFVYVDVRNCLRKNGDGFFDYVCEKIIAAAQAHFALSSSKTGEDRFMDILEQVKDREYHTTMLLDAFDEITRNKAFDPEFFLFLRAQASAGLVSYVVASILPLDQIAHQEIEGSPFFNIFSPVHIELLSPQEARNLVLLPSQAAGCAFSEEECAWVLELAGRHPFFIMTVCNALFTFKQTFPQPTSALERKTLEETIYKVLVSHFAYMWKELSNESQMSIIAKLQQLDISISDESLPSLITSSLFCRYVCVEHAFLDTIKDELKNVLKHLDTPPLLANSKLRYLKIATMRFEQRGVTSNYEKGLVIRGLLNEALEQLRGEGTREDIAPSWTFYNILHYNYFSANNALIQEGIAQRLAISLRQYHREKNLAIEAILNRLIEMETACQ